MELFCGLFTLVISSLGSEGRVGWQVCTLEGHSSEMISAVFFPDGTRILSVSDDVVKIWGAAPGAEVRSFVGVR